jgi:hypothetical protein
MMAPVALAPLGELANRVEPAPLLVLAQGQVAATALAPLPAVLVNLDEALAAR